METFKVRLNCLDYYQAKSTEFDPPVPLGRTDGKIKGKSRVPVIRVFGATETGQKVLMHVHGAFQYCYIEYSGSLAEREVKVAIRTLQLSIDQALAISYRKNIPDGPYFYVAHISLVKGIPFYGFHVGYKFYLKIYLLNPLHMTRLADLLREGAVMKRVLQPCESHMQYLAQWMCDYNLYGCAYIDCRKVKFRGPVPDSGDVNTELHRWHSGSVPCDEISSQDRLPKQSHCSLEVDVCVQDILNRHDVHARLLHHDFVERVNPIPSDAKLVQSMAGLWKDETRRRKAQLGLTHPGSTPFPPEVLVTMSADPRSSQTGGWIHEIEYRERMSQIASEEHEHSERGNVTFENFVKSVPLQDAIKTALESVEDLYPKNLALTENVSIDQDIEVPTAVATRHGLVDESRIQHIGQESSSDSEKTIQTINGDLKHKNQTPHAGASKFSSNATKAEVTSPVNSSEYAELGIRRVGETSHIEDSFIIPAEFVASVNHITRDQGDTSNPGGVLSQPRRKKHRRLIDEKYLLPDFDCMFAAPLNDTCETSSSDPATMLDDTLSLTPFSRQGPRVLPSSQKNASQTELHDSRLQFPVVKDPHDPNVISRLSQQSSSPTKSVQEPRKESVVSASTSQHNSSRISALSSQFSLGPPSFLQSPPRGIRPANSSSRNLVFSYSCPSFSEVQNTMSDEDLPTAIYHSAYYSDEVDVPERQREYAGREFRLEGNTEPYLPEFDATGTSLATYGRKPPILLDRESEKKADLKRRRLCKMSFWSIVDLPPSRDEVEKYFEQETRLDARSEVRQKKAKVSKRVLSQIEGPTQRNHNGFKYSQKEKSTSVQHETQYMSTMSLEVHVDTRGSLAPNPDQDEVACIFWSVQSDDSDSETEGLQGLRRTGILVKGEMGGSIRNFCRMTPVEVVSEPTELDLLTRLTDVVRMYDPDILTGYEVHNSSWGYLIERARLKYELNLCDEMSRMKSQSHGRFGKDDDRWGFNQTSTIRVTGRHTINIWRAMRGELNLLQYTMENVVFHLLHRRIPHYKFADLTSWYRSGVPREISKVIQYFISRVRMDLEILDSNGLVPRTSEQARLLGVDWFSVISRGSQFKVESLLFRIAKPENFILVSPSRRQVGGQNSLECLPLVMEPQSDFYTSPLLVLDFQSLYPSVMIAYNYCYSTFLGRVVGWRGTNKMGFTDYQRERRLIELLKDHINIAPNGIMYAKSHIRKSSLAKMLTEILETRVMVKSGMKANKDDKTLQRLLNNRQLALKLIANVTYGYTSASFSGRMPCSEIADSIVQTGRETLERTVAFIHSIRRWGAEVVYGDTDSLFVYLKGRTREQAFDIGEEIVKEVTNMNPRPIKLKFEKVYHPCVLLAKKRYVGFKYEHRNQTEPEFDAKGVETVRRDGTPAEQKIEEKALKILFRTADLSQVKSFFQSQCDKIMRAKVSIQDFCFAREVKLGTYSDKGPPPPGALISARKMIEDPRLEPQYGERVPYVVVTGGPSARLIDRCVAPEVLLQDIQLALDAEYYISKNIIPPLERIFNLVGANVRQWYDEMPKYQGIRRVEGMASGPNNNSNNNTINNKNHTSNGPQQAAANAKRTLESYMKSSTCIVCPESLLTTNVARPSSSSSASSSSSFSSSSSSSTSSIPSPPSPLCANCQAKSPHTTFFLRSKLVEAERKSAQLHAVCRSCSGLAWSEPVRCDSKDCSVFYSRMRQSADLASTRARLEPVLRGLEERVEKEGRGRRGRRGRKGRKGRKGKGKGKERKRIDGGALEW